MTDNIYHVIPNNDLRDHESSKDCWCHPDEETETPGLWVHHSMDRREEYEQGRKPH
jgi:hypothetical protein